MNAGTMRIYNISICNMNFKCIQAII